MGALIIMGLAAIGTVACVVLFIYFCVTTYIDTMEFRRSLDSNFLLSEKEAQTRMEFKTYRKGELDGNGD